jgi:DNA-binding PadR family transcriptional regulator
MPPLRQTAGIAGLGRFAEPAVLILVSLAGGDKHGYAINADIEHFSGLSLGAGTLYGAIARLEERGLIEALPAADRRHPYHLTAEGAAALEAQARRLQRIGTAALDRLVRPG